MSERTFRPYEVVFRVTQDDTYEVFLKWYVRRYQDEVRLRQSKMDWSKTVAKFAPVSSNALTNRHWRKTAPVAPAYRRATCGDGSLQGAFPPTSAQGETEKEKIQKELLALRGEISELAKDVASIDGVLAPIWAAERDAREAIMRTHGRDPANRIVFLQGGAGQRVGPFQELLEIAEQWGPTKSERRELVTRMKAYERLVERLTKMLLKGKPRSKGART